MKWEKENSGFKPVKFNLKTDLVLDPVCAEGLGKYIYFYLLYSGSLRVFFCTQLYDIKYSYLIQTICIHYPVGWGCRIHLPNECPGYDTKQSVMLGLWGMQSTPSLPLLSGPLWLCVVAPDRALSMG